MHTAAETEPAIDLLAGSFYGAEPHAPYAWLREHAPVHFDAGPTASGASARHADVKRLRRTPPASRTHGRRPADSGALR